MYRRKKLLLIVSVSILFYGCEAGETMKKGVENASIVQKEIVENKKGKLLEEKEEKNSIVVGLFEEVKIKKVDDVLFLSDTFLEKSLGIKKVPLGEGRFQLSFQRDDQVTNITFKENSIFVAQEYRNNLEEKQWVNKLGAPFETDDSLTWFPLNVVLDTFSFKYMKLDNGEKIEIDMTNLRIEPKTTGERYEIDGDVFYLTDFETTLFYLTNKEREKNGFLPLMLDIETSKVGRMKSKDLHDNDYFEHNSLTLGTPFEMLQNAGVTFTYAGENLAAGYETPEEVMSGWLESQGHKANILRREFERVGIGAFLGDKGYERYYTQIFTSK